MDKSAGKTQTEKQQQKQKGFKKKIGRVFHRSKSSGNQEEKCSRTVNKELDCSPDSQTSDSFSRRRHWGSWRQKKSSESVMSLPALLSPPRDDIPLRTSDWMLAEEVTQDSDVVYNYDHIADIVQNTKLEPQSPTSPKSPNEKSTKFQNIRFPVSGKAEEGKKKQVLDYLGGIFSSTRRKNSKIASPASLSQINSVEESPPVSREFSPSGESTIVGETPDSGIPSFSQDHRSKGVPEATAADQGLAEISHGSPEERGLLSGVGNPAEQSVSSPEKSDFASKNSIVVDRSLQSIHREAEEKTVPECVGEQLSPKTVGSNPTKDFVATFVGNLTNVFGSTLVNNEDTSLASASAAVSLLSDDRSVKECEIGELDSINEDISQNTGQLKVSAFVNSDRLAEGQCDCETIAHCVDIPAIKECVLPISETVRIEQVAEVVDIDVHPPKIKENSNVTLSETSVSLPINNIDVKQKALKTTLKNEEPAQLNHSAFQRFEKETENHNITEKLSFASTLAKQENTSKKDIFVPDTKKNQVEETGTSCVPHVDEDTETSHDVKQFTAGNLSGENHNGVVEPELNADKALTNSFIDVVNSKNTAENLFSGLKTDLNSATLVSDEMDDQSPMEAKQGKRKGRKRRSLKSGQQSGRDTGTADTNAVEKEFKEIVSNKPTQQSSEVSAKTASSPKQSTPPLVHCKTLPESFPPSEKSAQDVSKPVTSSKNISPWVPCSPTSGNGAVEGSPSNEDFIHSLQSSTTDELDEKIIALNSADQDGAIGLISQICNQQNSQTEQESGADPGQLKTLEINDSKRKSSKHNVITSQLYSTVTTRVRLPSAEKEGASGALISSNQQGTCTETRTEEEETIRITLPKKTKATSHHQVDFFAIKDLPFTSKENKKYTGSLKIQLHNKSDKRADATATKIGRKQPNTSKNAEASGDVNVEVRHKADEISEVICVKDSDTKHISAEEHKNTEMNTTSAHVEKMSLKTFPDAQTGEPEENSSLGMVSSVLSAHTDMKGQSSSVDMHISEIRLSEIDAPAKSVKGHKADLVAATTDLVLSVSFPGAGLQSQEVEEKAVLPLSVLTCETTVSEIEKGAPTKTANKQKAILGEAKGDLVQPVQQNIPKVETRDIEVADTTLPQKVQTSITAASDVKDMNANHVGNQKGRLSAAIVEAAQQSPSKSQPREIKDIVSPERTQMSETIPEFEKEVPAKSDNKRTSVSGAAKGELAQESLPMSQISDSKTKIMSPQPIQIIKSTVSEMKKDTNANCVGEQLECLGTATLEGALAVQLSSSQAQPGRTEIKDTSPQSVEVSETEKEALAISFNKEKSGTDTLTSDVVLPLQKSTISLKYKEKEIHDIPSVSMEASKIIMHESKTDTPTSIVSDNESGSNVATVGLALPLQQNMPMLQNNDSEIKDTVSLQSVQTFKTMGDEINNKTSANSSNELNTLTSDHLILPVQKGAVDLPYRGVEVNDVSVCLEASSTVAEIKKGAPENGGCDTESGSTATRGGPAVPAEQSMSVLENTGFEIREATLPQSIETTESEMNKDTSTAAAFEQKASSEAATSKFGLPVLSSTPKVQYKQMELKSALSASSLEAPTGNISRTEDAQTASAIEKISELSAATNEFSLPVQNIIESQPREAIVKEAPVVDDTWTTKAIVGPVVDLDSSTDGFTSSIEQTASKSQEGNELNVSFTEGSSLDSSSDMDSFTETIRKYGNPIQLPQKKQRVPKVPFVPPFAMPPIQEDRMSPKKEKTFDPSSFKVGLMKNSKRENITPSTLLKMQQIETKSKVVKRVSAEQSLLFKSLKNRSSLLHFLKRDDTGNDFASESDSKRSRLDVDHLLTQTSKPSTEFVMKPTDLTLRNDVAKEFEFDLSNPPFAETQLPSYMEKPNNSEVGKKSGNCEAEKQSENGLTIPDLKPNLSEINTNFGDITNTCALDGIPAFQGSNTINGNQNLPSLFNTDLFNPNSVLPNLLEVGMPGTSDLTLNPRPGKIVIYNQRNFCGEAIEVFHDVEDATSWKLPSEIFIRVVRGCWLLFQKPNFEGGKIALEEGVVEFADMWGEEMDEDSCDKTSTSTPNKASIGSIRRIVKKWGLSEIDLCTQLHGLGRRTTYFDDMEEIRTYGIMEPIFSLEVHSGSWLLFEQPFYEGNSYIVESGLYPCPESWDATDPFISSLKPLKMGTLKVEKLNDNKVIVYEKPFFEGKQLELNTDVFSFTGGDEESALCHTYPFANVGSMKVLGGFWVGYEKSAFQGHQYVLEEGEYQAWNDWGGYNERLQSLRFIQVNLSTPAVIMYSGLNFSAGSGNIEILGPVPDLQHTDYGLRTMSINVLSGTWVAYENTDFTGEQYVLEKGLYSSYEDWGATNFQISSIQPVLVDMVDSELSKFKVQFFSEPELQGSTYVFDVDTAQFPAGFSPRSCKVQNGSWVAYDAENFTGNEYILEEETYPDLFMVGCANESRIKSVRTIGFCFSIPGIVLFAREKFEGKKIELTSEVLNLALEGYNSKIFSVKVYGGIWVAYECSNYRGRQIVLQSCQIPNWHQHTGWHRIGSLRPLIQKRVYFRVRNRGNGTFMTFAGELNEIAMVRVQALEDTGMDNQIWFYQDGFIKTKMAEDCCLDVIGSLFNKGSRLGIAVQDSKDIHIWNISSDGVILSGIRSDLLIDIKGGQHYDQNQTILNGFDEFQSTQRWDLEIL
ncbi:beta/gamma crystallin domain-containing protein 1 isoform X2 [Heterodontus francisci]|uniref:beta/gamma crystallin domain-containing protein 1 isoform X2 n=1 Tax=Heterodontus francisci TaxID=7792 RepID=UPI00355B5E2A